MSERDPQELVADVERLLEQIETLPDATARQTATDVVQALLDLYGAGLERIVEEVAERDDGELAAALGGDELVAHLLLLHGLHPVPVRERVLMALGEVRPYLESHGGNVELLAVEETSVRLRLEGSCSGCPSSAMTLKLAIEDAIHKAAPEIEEVIADEAGSEPSGAGLLQIDQVDAGETVSPPSGTELLQIELAPAMAGMAGAPATGPAPATGAGPGPAPALEASWNMAGGLPELSGGGMVVKQVGGQPILFLKAGDRFYGYRPECPACEAPLAGAQLRAAELTCPSCGDRYDILRAGRGLDAPARHLEPVPLLVGEDGLVKVALPVAA